MPQTPLGELTVRSPAPVAGFGGRFAPKGRSWAGEEKGRVGEGEGGKWRAPKLLLNQGPSDSCYATESINAGRPNVKQIMSC